MRGGFISAASQDWGLGFGPVTVGRERAKRACDLWIPPQNLKTQSWRAREGRSERERNATRMNEF